MDDRHTGVSAEDKRRAKTAKQAVVYSFYWYNFADGREARRFESWIGGADAAHEAPIRGETCPFLARALYIRQ